MLKKQKLHLLILLTAALSIFSVSGCAENAGKTEKNSGDSPPKTVELTVSAAASLADSLNEMKKVYEHQFPHVSLTFNFGGSGTLQRQIEQGAPVDIFLSAGNKQMDALKKQNLVDPLTVGPLLQNELVLIVPADSSLIINKLEDVAVPGLQKLAIGTPESVPAGSYAKQALTAYKLWDSIQPKLVYTKDVRQVLTYVETGNTEAGIVYKTDAMISKKVKIAATIDPASHNPIEYPAGLVQATTHRKEAEAFLNYLRSKEAGDIFIKYGFSLSEKAQ